MRLSISFITLILSIFSVNCSDKSSAEDQKSHKAIIYYNGEGELKIDYEGTGLRKQSEIFDKGKKVTFVGIHLSDYSVADWKDIKYEDASFAGSITTTGLPDDEVSCNLSVSNKVPMIIEFLGLESQNKTKTVYDLSPGKHNVVFKANIVKFYERE